MHLHKVIIRNSGKMECYLADDFDTIPPTLLSENDRVAYVEATDAMEAMAIAAQFLGGSIMKEYRLVKAAVPCKQGKLVSTIDKEAGVVKPADAPIDIPRLIKVPVKDIGDGWFLLKSRWEDNDET